MSQPDFTNLRAEERRESRFQAKFFLTDVQTDCAILDISPGGAKLKAGIAVTVRTEILLDLDKIGQFSADTVWCSNGIIGIRFTGDQSLTADAVMALAMFGTG